MRRVYVTARAFLTKLSQSYKLQPGHLIRHGWIYCLIFISKPICSTVNGVGGSPPELKGQCIAFNSITLENIIQLSDASVLFLHCKTYQTSLRGNISIRASTKVADLYSLPYFTFVLTQLSLVASSLLSIICLEGTPCFGSLCWSDQIQLLQPIVTPTTWIPNIINPLRTTSSLQQSCSLSVSSQR